MDYLLEFASREDVQALSRSYLDRSDAVQGITIDLDDFWLASWRLNTLLSPNDFRLAQSQLFSFWRYDGLWPWATAELSELGRLGREGFVGYPFGVDTSWRPPLWAEYTAMRELRDEPFSVTVILRPDASQGSSYSLSEIDTAGLQVRFDARPIARLYAKSTDALRPVVGGVSVSSAAGPPGTLGGIVEDGSGGRVGLTCSHVLASGEDAQQPSPKDNARGAASIGACSAGSALNSHVPPLDLFDDSLNEVDVAVIDLTQPSELAILGVGGLSGIAPKSRINPDASVRVAGKSGRRTRYVGGLSVREFDFNGTKYGYKNLFELKPRSRFWGFTGTFSPPVEPGDSGGWVLIEGANGTEWLGVIVGGDGPVGYAAAAEFVTDWLRTNTSLHPPFSVS